MIKDLVVNLGGAGTPDVTADYAISVAQGLRRPCRRASPLSTSR